MTTREDYEAAALAGGIHIVSWVSGIPQINTSETTINYAYWMPLDNDGDSRRLEVACLMDIEFQTCEYGRVVHANEQGCGYMKPVDLGTDPCAATRKVVFRCAVEIGKRMKGGE